MTKRRGQEVVPGATFPPPASEPPPPPPLSAGRGADKVQIEFIAGPNTPPEWAHKVGTKTFPFELPKYMPIGVPATLMGVPGYMRDGLQWEIAAVDLRDEVTKLLDEAAEVLKQKPVAGERMDVVFARQAQTQHLLLKAQLAILRRMR